MESNLVPISEIRKKGVWHFLPYSQAVRRAESALEQSIHPITPLRDLVQSTQRGFSIPSSTYQEEGIPFIRLLNLEGGKIDWTTVVYISPEHHDRLEKTQLHQGNVLVGLISQPNIKVTVYDCDRPANINQNLVKLDLKTDRINPHYLAYYLQTDVMQTLLMSRAIGTTLPIIRVQDLMELGISCPTISQQQEILTAAQNLDQNPIQHVEQFLWGEIQLCL